MRVISLALASAAAAGGLLAGCSTSPATLSPAIPSVKAVWTDRLRPQTISVKDLFVGYPQNTIEIYQNGSFRQVGYIHTGIDEPLGSWVDSHGLYVANAFGADITQYSSPRAKPFKYTAGITAPAAVTTDSQGNVFEADYGNASRAWINEYAQHSNVVKATCSWSYGSLGGVAVDASGDVFVAVSQGSGAGTIAEYTNFAGCIGQKLGVKLHAGLGGMALDKNNDIIICEWSYAAVDVIKPPYNSVSSHLDSGWQEPVDVTINSANNRVWVTDAVLGKVYDLYYPSGKIVAGIANGYAPSSAVDGSNYVP